MSEPIFDIHDPISEICERLGLVPENVAEILFTPRTVTATVYKLNANGNKYTEPSPEILPPADPDADITGFSTRPVTETRKFKVHT